MTGQSRNSLRRLDMFRSGPGCRATSGVFRTVLCGDGRRRLWLRSVSIAPIRHNRSAVGSAGTAGGRSASAVRERGVVMRLLRRGRSRSARAGSGIVLDKAGHIVTNNTRRNRGQSLTVTTIDCNRLPPTLVGSFPPDAWRGQGLGCRPQDAGVLRRLVPALSGISRSRSANPLVGVSSVTECIVSACRR